MTVTNAAVCAMFFWYGFSLVFYTAGFISASRDRNQSPKVKGQRAKRLVVGLICFVVGLVGVFGLALMLGIYNASNEYVNQFMILGGVIGLLVSRLLRPRQAS